ncbi:MAG: MerR family transcriptional regulator [Bacteriovoracaceae bacterium]
MHKFSIKALSRNCGVLPHTLRTWERRYAVFHPERSSGGQRVYTENDLKKALLLKKLIESGYAISQLSQYSLKELESKLDSTIDKREHLPVNFYFKDIHKRILKLIEQFEVEKIKNEINYLRLSTNVRQFIFDFSLPLLRNIGEMVYQNRLTVTQEHIISNIIADEIIKIETRASGITETKIALATADGNLHELSLQMANLICHTHRQETVYLGASHPSNSLANALNTIRPTCLVLGVVSSDLWNYEKKIRSYLKELDHALEFELEIILGGGAKLEFPHYKKIKKLMIISTLEDFDNFLAKY